jgi:hypothetical protein
VLIPGISTSWSLHRGSGGSGGFRKFENVKNPAMPNFSQNYSLEFICLLVLFGVLSFTVERKLLILNSVLKLKGFLKGSKPSRTKEKKLFKHGSLLGSKNFWKHPSEIIVPY